MTVDGRPATGNRRWEIVPLLMACTITINTAVLAAEGHMWAIAAGGIPLLGAAWAYAQILRHRGRYNAI